MLGCMLGVISKRLVDNKDNALETRQQQALCALDIIVDLFCKGKIKIVSGNQSIFKAQERLKKLKEERIAGRWAERDEMDYLYELLSLLYAVAKESQNYDWLLRLHSSCLLDSCCLEIAVINDDVELFQQLVLCGDAKEMTDDDKHRFYFDAGSRGCLNMVKHLFDPTVVDSDGNTILHIAARQDWTFLQQVMLCHDNLPQALRIKNNNNETAFYRATYSNLLSDPIKDFSPYISNDPYFFQQELYNAAGVLKSEHTENFILLCNISAFGSNCFNKFNFEVRNKKGERPVDKAIKRHKQACKIAQFNEACVMEAEKIKHIFLFRTAHIEDSELIEIFKDKCLPNDVIKNIMQYHHYNDADRLVAERVALKADLLNYHKLNKFSKEEFKKDQIRLADERVSKFLLEQA